MTKLTQPDPAPLRGDAAFVVHITGADAANPAAVCGRAEHVTTGRSLRFRDADQLIGFFRGAIAGGGSRGTVALRPEDEGDPLQHASSRQFRKGGLDDER
jgi:hypothetical protein